MALPKKLKNFALFVDGESYVGEVTEVTLPKLTRQTEDFRAGGMSGPIKSNMGLEGLELQWKTAGYLRSLLAQWGISTTSGVLLRFAGALQSDDTNGIDSLEVVVRGYHTEMDFGTAKAGDPTEIQITSALSYYRLSLNGQTIIEIDLPNLVEIVNGQDLMADVRTAIGL